MFEKYYNELIGYFSYYLKDKDRAYEVVHECYSRVLAMSPHIPPIREPRAFLYKTTRNIIINEKNGGGLLCHVNSIVLSDVTML